MSKDKKEIAKINNTPIDEKSMFAYVAQIIENRKASAGAYANREITIMYWEIGRYINTVLLGNERAGTAKRFSRHCRENWSRCTARVLTKRIYIA